MPRNSKGTFAPFEAVSCWVAAETRFITWQGLKLYYEIAGEGTPLLWVDGGPARE